MAREAEQKAGTARATMAQAGLDTSRGSPSMVGNFFALDKFEKEQDAWYRGETQYADWKNKEASTRFETKMRADSSRAQARVSLLGALTGGIKALAGGVKSGGFGGSEVG